MACLTSTSLSCTPNAPSKKIDWITNAQQTNYSTRPRILPAHSRAARQSHETAKHSTRNGYKTASDPLDTAPCRRRGGLSVCLRHRCEQVEERQGARVLGRQAAALHGEIVWLCVFAVLPGSSAWS